MKKENTVSPKEAAEIMNMDVLTLRCMIQDGKFDWAVYNKRKHARRGSYVISRQGMMNWLGINQ